MPVPFFGFEDLYEDLARTEWDSEVGALPPFEFADKAKIAAALAHPFSSAGGRPTWPSVPAKAAALFRGLVKNHGLVDGNKRLSVTMMSTFLVANGWVPLYTNPQLYHYALRVARHRGNYPVKAIERWIHRHSELMSDEDLATVRNQNRRIFARDPDLLSHAFEIEDVSRDRD